MSVKVQSQREKEKKEKNHEQFSEMTIKTFWIAQQDASVQFC